MASAVGTPLYPRRRESSPRRCFEPWAASATAPSLITRPASELTHPPYPRESDRAAALPPPAAGLLAVLVAPNLWADQLKTEKKDRPEEVRLDVPYVPTPQKVVDEMLKLAGVKDGDVVYDLGCGDGRIVVTAVKSFKAKKGLGLDIDPQRIKEAKKNAKDAKVDDKVELRRGGHPQAGRRVRGVRRHPVPLAGDQPEAQADPPADP